MNSPSSEPVDDHEPSQPCEIPTCPRTADVRGLCRPCYCAVDRFRSYPRETLDQVIDALSTSLERAIRAKSA